MPVKYICDSCGKETDRNYSFDTFKGRDYETDLHYEILVKEKTFFDVTCKRCVITVLRNVIKLLTEEPRVTNPIKKDEEDARS